MLSPLAGTLGPLGMSRTAAPVLFSPLDIAGCQLWLKADAITGLSDGAAIDNWPDSSPNVRNFAKISDPTRPAYMASALNGLPAVAFAGAHQLLNSALLTAGTLIVVTNATGYTVANELIATSAGYVGRLYPNIDTWYNGDISDLVAYATNGTLYVNGAHTASNSPAAAYKVISFACTSAAPITSTYLGGSTPSRYWRGSIAEIIIYDSVLSLANRQAVETYLAAKYALTLA